MKTPDEIKKGLACCSAKDKCGADCPYGDNCDLGGMELERDALDYIQQLETERVEVVRCKDCIMVMKLSDAEKRLFRNDALKCSMTGCIVLPNDYCSYGEKAEED